MVRLFFGLTFIIAGLDKLLDPSFFDPAAPGSIQAQFAVFERFSPLAPLIRLSEPMAVPIGLLIALGELGAGIGALTGLSFRLAAAGGAALSLLFYLTASWTTQPYYFGPDLPYAAGWLALAIAGDGGLFVFGRPGSGVAHTQAQTATGQLISRRQVLRVGALTALTLAVGAAADSVRLLWPSATGSVIGTPTPTAQPSPAPTPSAATGIAVATVVDVEQHGALRFRVPISAPPPLPAGDPAIIVDLGDGNFTAYDATCPHQGCTVVYRPASGILFCPCHGAEFDPGQHGQAIAGPTRRPLLELPLIIDATSGEIALRTS